MHAYANVNTTLLNYQSVNTSIINGCLNTMLEPRDSSSDQIHPCTATEQNTKYQGISLARMCFGEFRNSYVPLSFPALILFWLSHNKSSQETYRYSILKNIILKILQPQLYTCHIQYNLWAETILATWKKGLFLRVIFTLASILISGILPYCMLKYPLQCAHFSRYLKNQWWQDHNLVS